MTSSTQPGLIERLGELAARAANAKSIIKRVAKTRADNGGCVNGTEYGLERAAVSAYHEAAREAVNALPALLATLSSQARLIEAVGKALEPFAEFINTPGAESMPGSMPLTLGSNMARNQLTLAEFRRAREALALLTKETTNAR